jgi:transcriptional regulator with GAF, ATPase, and Fis domain/serine/threonine protein kinase
LVLPTRYEALYCLGSGGGGEVWAVRDRFSGERRAFKILAAEATEAEMAALVREAVALSGLEGLGVPRVLQFGRLSSSGRPYLVRELVEGRSLMQLISEKAEPTSLFFALAVAAEQVTRAHRAGFFHGDIKPANIIVEPNGHGTLVDLGLAAPWQEGGAAARGLTPKYAAPELFVGKPLTVRAEVYAFGATLSEILQAFADREPEKTFVDLRTVAETATREEPSERYPSADEFAAALRRAARLGEQEESAGSALVWPVVGIDATSSRLLDAVRALQLGERLWLKGPAGSGRSVLLRRLGWSLGVGGSPLVWIDGSEARSSGEVSEELAAQTSEGLIVLLDDAERLDAGTTRTLVEAARTGIRIVLTGEGALTEASRPFEIPPLSGPVLTDLVRRAVPSLTNGVVKRVIEHSDGRPGELRRLVDLIARHPVVREGDVDELMAGFDDVSRQAPSDPCERLVYLLEHGRYNAARVALEEIGETSRLDVAIARARLELGLGEAAQAVSLLESIRQRVEHEDLEIRRAWALWAGRAQIAIGSYSKALELLSSTSMMNDALGIEAKAYEGLALAHLSEDDEADRRLKEAVSNAEELGFARVHAVALACLGLVQQRSDSEGARLTYQRAIVAAQQAGDAGQLGTVQLNLATLLGISGDIAGSMEHYEAAVDMGQRSGRRSTVRNALLNLANADLYLGRSARARASIEALEAQRAQLSPVQRAQLLGLWADLYVREANHEAGARHYEACAAAFEALGLTVDAAEARLEGVLVAARGEIGDVTDLNREIARAVAELGSSGSHRPLLALATARVAWVAGDEKGARASLEEALAAAREAGKREWIWRTLATRAEVEASGGQPLLARRDREEALATLEEIAARLPRDLREVFWNDARRRQLKGLVEQSFAYAPTEVLSFQMPNDRQSITKSSVSISLLTRTPLEQRLARILEINRELLAEFDLERLTSRVTEYAVELLDAERGFVLLRENGGQLSVHTSRTRAGDEAHGEFSRSIAQQVMTTREPIVTSNARQDSRMRAYESVHQLMLESVACVPVRGRSGAPLGALYLEMRGHSARAFDRELPMLQAFADQVGLAIETARLVSENRERAVELTTANEQLTLTQARLKELLGDRTEKLKEARRRLRDAQDTLYGRFGYQGMVGTSASMRRVYALIDRLKETDVSVLITGESGTGKEVAARAIHKSSVRNKRPFLAINCGAIPEHLLESELFGHTRGAFTGADRERKGLLREAEGGSMLLDEIGEMPHKMQAGLLRVLQEKTVRPVGGTKEEPVDVRFIFATHRDLEELVRLGKFREDLYYRIHVVEVEIPPLRERRDDIPVLADHFLGIFSARYRRDKKLLSREAQRSLISFDWPGNVRQLEHVLLNAWILSEGQEIEVGDLELPLDSPSRRGSSETASSAEGTRADSEHRDQKTLSKRRREEKEKILEALEAANWNRMRAAELSGIPRRTFYRRLREYNIQ